MRIHAISDLHIDYTDNQRWLQSLSAADFRDDILILAGDISEDLDLLFEALDRLQSVFAQVCFVPGNHDLWVRNSDFDCSLQKFEFLMNHCRQAGILVDVFRREGLSLVPLLGWYDYSFATPGRYLRRAWRDYRACTWPESMADSAAVNRHFLSLNESRLEETNDTVISYSHFVPRIDLMPDRIPADRRRVYPVLGSESLGRQVEQLKPAVHVYGHSHVNRALELDGVYYVNNAFGYPSETRITRKHLHCIYPLDECAGAAAK